MTYEHNRTRSFRDWKFTSDRDGVNVFVDVTLGELMMRAIPWILMTVITAFAVVVTVADDDDVESKVISKIELLGGKVTRDQTLPGRPVIRVDFEGSKRFTDGYIHVLRAFASLQELNLRDTRITDAGLKEIGEFKTLTSLCLNNTAITDQGLKEVGALTNLTSLSLYHTRITDVGLKHVAELKTLTSLNIGMTRVTDAGMKELCDLRHLTKLDLFNSKLTDDGLKELKKLKTLELLVLGISMVTDSGAREIGKSLPDLEIRRNGVVAQRDLKVPAKQEVIFPRIRIIQIEPDADQQIEVKVIED